jgi:hypothetical protein
MKSYPVTWLDFNTIKCYWMVMKALLCKDTKEPKLK